MALRARGRGAETSNKDKKANKRTPQNERVAAAPPFEQSLERRELGRVAGGRAGRVRVDVVNFHCIQVGVAQRGVRGAQDARAVRRRRRHVHGVAAEAVAAQLRVGARAPARRARRVLEDEHGGALAEHEAAPRGVEGPRGAVAREGAHAREAPQRDLVDARLGAAAEGDVAVPALDEAERVAHGLGPGGARRGRRLHGARARMFEGHGAGRRVAERARHEERRELLAFGDAVRRVDDVAQAADARRDRRAAPRRRVGLEAAGVADRLGGRAERQRDDPRLLPLLVERQVAAARRDERRAVDVELCCRRLAALRAPPALRGGAAQRRRAAEPRDHDAA